MKIFFWRNRTSISAEEKKSLNEDRILLIISGILLALSFPPVPFPAPILLFFALVPYLIVIERREKLIDINRATYLMAFVFCLLTLYWVGSWQKKADSFLMISGTLLVFVNPIFFLIPSTLLYFTRKIFSPQHALYFLPVFYVAYEYAYMLTDLSFPWLSLGNGLSLFTLFIQIADIIGQLGLSLVIVLINVLLYKIIFAYKQQHKKLLYSGSLILFFIFILILIYGIQKLNNFPRQVTKVRVGLIQPNLDPWDKWSGGSLDSLTDLYFELSKKAIQQGAEIVIWPETALPVYLRGGSHDDVIQSINSFCDTNNVFLLTGMPDVKFYFDSLNLPKDAKHGEKGNYYYVTYNSILLFSPNKKIVESYGKIKLVPFGERVPFVDVFPFLGRLIKWGVGLSGWNVGKDTTVFQLNLNGKEVGIAGLVCYESIYPVFVSEFIKRKADFIAVVTNDSWYGNLSGPYQHKEFAALRAVENRRSVVRAANGGISCIINSFGETHQQSAMFTKSVIVGDVELSSEETFFTKYGGLIPVICSAFSIWIIGISILFKMKIKFKL